MLDLLQWPAMVVTILATWFVGSEKRHRRQIGFWTFIASNLLWTVWGFYAQAYALVLLQFALAAMNIRGAVKAD